MTKMIPVAVLYAPVRGIACVCARDCVRACVDVRVRAQVFQRIVYVRRAEGAALQRSKGPKL